MVGCISSGPSDQMMGGGWVGGWGWGVGMQLLLWSELYVDLHPLTSFLFHSFLFHINSIQNHYLIFLPYKTMFTLMLHTCIFALYFSWADPSLILMKCPWHIHGPNEQDHSINSAWHTWTFYLFFFCFWMCIVYCVWYGVEKQGFSIFSYINFLSATTEEAFIANARPYKFVARLKRKPTRFK